MTSGQLALLGLLVVIAVCSAAPKKGNDVRCESYGGEKLHKFNRDRERMTVPCKYNAINGTRCGKYLVTVIPGLGLDPTAEDYVVKTVLIQVTDLQGNLLFKGNSNENLVIQAVQSKNGIPFKKQGGSKNFYQLFPKKTLKLSKAMLFAKSEDNQFSIGFFPYQEQIESSLQTSGFAFECNHPSFVPTSYPQQVCGDMKGIGKPSKKNADNDATILVNIFRNNGIKQSNEECCAIADTMTNYCSPKRAKLAAETCRHIFSDKKTRKCLMVEDNIRKAFKNCVRAMCDKKEAKYCIMLKKQMGKCCGYLQSVLKEHKNKELKNCV